MNIIDRRHEKERSSAGQGDPVPINASRRAFGGAVAALGAASLMAVPRLSRAAAWRPAENIEFVVPAGPGGALDQAGRAMKQHFDESGQAAPGRSFLVSNKAGANGKIAFDVLRQHPADPYFLSVNSHGYLASYLTSNLDTLPHRDLTTIAVLQDDFLTLAVRADSPIKDVQDLLTKLRRDPGSQRVAVATSIGNHIHVGTAKALKAGGVDIKRLVVVPFRSSSASLVALVGGHIELVASTTPNVIGLLQDGRIRLLAVSSDKRLGGIFAGVPTWRESGVDATFSSAFGIVAPKGLDPEQIAYWEDLCRNMVQSTVWRNLAERNQNHPNFMPHAEAVAYYEKEYQGMRSIVSELGLLKAGR